MMRSMTGPVQQSGQINGHPAGAAAVSIGFTDDGYTQFIH
ncbi:MAG: hypothetical protein Kow00100_10930 [Geothermobacteraceae bacterium]